MKALLIKHTERVNSRADAAYLLETYAATERRACELAHIPQADVERDTQLKARLTALAQDQPRYGYRRLEVLLRREGEVVKHKRIFRNHQAAGLSVECKKRKRPMRAGRPLSVASALQFTRECLALDVDSFLLSMLLASAVVGEGGPRADPYLSQQIGGVMEARRQALQKSRAYRKP